MSFSAKVKKELCRILLMSRLCAIAESYGIILSCTTVSAGQINIVMENIEFAERLPKLFYKESGLNFDILPEQDELGSNSTFLMTE